MSLGLLIGGLAGCKIVKNGTSDKTDPQKPDSFDAEAYVDTLWSSKILPFFASGAHDLAPVLMGIAKDSDATNKQFGQPPAADGGAWTFAVKGVGRVTAADLKSAHGTLTLQADRVPSPVVLQVGPVVFGSAIRDCLPFLVFTEFVNQIEYAEVSRALNTRAMAEVRKQVDPAILLGKTISFSGGMADPSSTGEITITPVMLAVPDANR